jgi:hypothetical protein
MTQETKQTETPNPMEMGMEMAKKMMGQMGKDGPNPIAMMQKMMAQMGEGKEGAAPMPPMMQMCMGMCGEMLKAIKRTTDMAAFATPELYQLFTQWLETLEGQALEHLKDSGKADIEALAKVLNISEESTAFLIAGMIGSGKVDAELRPAKA